MFGKEFISFFESNDKHFETGFSELDNCIFGVTKGSLITIGARPAMGKTSFSISICNHLLEMNKKILFCELDCSEFMIEKQFISVKTKLAQPIASIIGAKKEWKEITKAIQFFNDKHFEPFCKMNMTIDELEEKIKEEMPEIVFIDCIQCLKMPKAPNLTDAVNLTIKEVKRIALENNLIIILTSQASRAPENRYNKRPMLSDLRNGSLLEDLSDIVLMIYRESYYDKENIDFKNKAEIIIVKNKFGDLNNFTLKFQNGIFSDFSTEDYIKAVFS